MKTEEAMRQLIREKFSSLTKEELEKILRMIEKVEAKHKTKASKRS